jgi:hypothetical protein
MIMEPEQVDERIAELVKKRAEAQRESDAARERVQQISDDISRLYIVHTKTLAAPYVGHAYEDTRDGSFIIVKKWDDNKGSLIATEFLPPEAAVGGNFTIHDRIVDISDLLDGWSTEISREQFSHRTDDFYKKYVENT